MAENDRPRSNCLSLALLLTVFLLVRSIPPPDVPRRPAVFAEVNPAVHEHFQQEAQKKAKLASTKGILGEPCLLYIVAVTVVAVVIMEPEHSLKCIVYLKYVLFVEAALFYPWWQPSRSLDFRQLVFLCACFNPEMIVNIHDPVHTYFKKFCEYVLNCMRDRGRGRSPQRSRTPRRKTPTGPRTRSQSRRPA